MAGGAIDQPWALTNRIIFLRSFEGWIRAMADATRRAEQDSNAEPLTLPPFWGELFERVYIQRYGLEEGAA